MAHDHRRTGLSGLPRLLLVPLMMLAACAGPGETVVEGVEDPPEPSREFRAAWVATVANIDWPSAPGLPVDQQQAEARAFLDRLVSLNMNAVVFQVRPHADALYASPLEPWSSYLTGEQGRAPEPFWDPLEFWVAEAHARGLQLHAWFNPYRANHPANRGGLAENSVVRAHPERVVKLGDKGYWWMDPARSDVQDHCVSVVLDVVRRYDVDGIHFDDYFYPYPSYNGGADFPDDASFEAYRLEGGELSRGDWRREAVDGLIQRLAREIKEVKPCVEFGLSPFGIWRPGNPPSIQGLDQHDVLFADARRWLREGWVDYFTPQLYWPIARIAQSFPVLLGWWTEQNLRGRHLWPGTSVARQRGAEGATEIVNQVMVTRGMTPESPGLCYFSLKWLMAEDDAVARALLAGPYARPALIPASPWLEGSPPEAPPASARRDGDALTVEWAADDRPEAWLWLVSSQRSGAWTHALHPAARSRCRLDSVTNLERVVLRAVDRRRVIGAPTEVLWPERPGGSAGLN